jgi:hypothetical protein
MRKLMLILLCCFVFTIKTQAQTFCEIDSVYRNFDREIGYKVIPTRDNNFVTLSISGLNGRLQVNYPVFVLRKLDACGTTIWQEEFDSSVCNACSAVSDLWEEEDGNIMFTAYFNANSHTLSKNGIRLFKTNSYGQLIWKVKMGDSLYKYSNIKSLKVSNNRYLFVGTFDRTPPQNKAIAIMSDTLGKTLYQDSFTTQAGGFHSAIRISDNDIMLLGAEDTSFLIINIDTNGNKTNSYKFPRGHNTWSVLNFKSSYNQTELFYSAYKNDLTLISRLNLQGGVIKDSIFNNIKRGYVSPESIDVNQINNSNYMISGSSVIIMDSNFNIVYFDSISKNNRQINQSILTGDSSIVSVGTSNFRTSGIGNVISDFWFGIKTISSMIKFITINGGSLINQSQGQLQLTALVLPSTAKNKNISWSINDTTIATINQTGLVKALKNGNVIVTASATDGSNIEATKSITIINQGVGLNKISEKNADVLIYPNPASDHINIQTSLIKIHTVYLTDISGKVLYSTNQVLSINIEEYTNGIYILKFETDKGVVFKKLIINK